MLEQPEEELLRNYWELLRKSSGSGQKMCVHNSDFPFSQFPWKEYCKQ
jgi:hypothetical protein